MEDESSEGMLDPRRNQSIERKKLYEIMLLTEIPGTTKHNEPLHAVLEAELGVSDSAEGQAQHVRNHALIHYLATLATSNDTKDTFDFDFVESLLNNGADVNSKDKTGQTVFHEVARSWNVDVASFLIKHGANINQQDDFGRSPLHVAAAVDYAEMVEFLLQNGADIAIKTKGEEQTPVHFAAKNDAINSLQMLLGYGANIDARDSKNRTPLQVSAEMNRSKASKLLIKEGAPCGVYDNLGNCALSLLIEKIPEVAVEAMDQFYSADVINRKEFYFLNYLEGPKLKEQKTPARTPLEIAVQNERFDIILHPVMQRLIGAKWQVYGKWGAILDLMINLLYSILWSVLGVTLPKYGKDLYLPIGENWWRFTIGIILFMLTGLEIRKQITNTIKTRQELKKWKEWRADELERDLQYCHPRWPQETQYLKAEIKAVRNLSLISGTDMWIYFDWVTLVFILATIISHVTFFHYSTDTSKDVHHYIMIILLLILWFRIFKYARPFESAGPFVVIFGSALVDIVKWGFMNVLIVVPFTCAFWITFGAVSLKPVEGYDHFGPLLYNIFSMMVVHNHNYEKLEEANPMMARLLCGGFIGIAAIVTLNLLIALLTNTFERLYENAVANAVMQRARTILLLQKCLRRKQKLKYYDFIRKKGSPEVISSDLGGVLLSDRDEHATIGRVREDLKTVLDVLGEHFGKRFGKKKKHDLDFVKTDVIQVKKSQEELKSDMKNIKSVLQEVKQVLESLVQQGNNDENNSDVDNSNDDDDNSNDNDSDEFDNSKTPLAFENTENGYHKTEREKAVALKQASSKKRQDNSASEEFDIPSASLNEVKAKRKSVLKKANRPKDNGHPHMPNYGRNEEPSANNTPPYSTKNYYNRFPDQDRYNNHQSEYLPARPELPVRELPFCAALPPSTILEPPFCRALPSSTVQGSPYEMVLPNGDVRYPPSRQHAVAGRSPNQYPGQPTSHTPPYLPAHHPQTTVKDLADQQAVQEQRYRPTVQNPENQTSRQNATRLPYPTPQPNNQHIQEVFPQATVNQQYYQPASTQFTYHQQPLTNQDLPQPNLSAAVQNPPYQFPQHEPLTQRPLQSQSHSQPSNQTSIHQLATPQSTTQSDSKNPEYDVRMSNGSRIPYYDLTEVAPTTYPQHEQTTNSQQLQSVENVQQPYEAMEDDVERPDVAELEGFEVEIKHPRYFGASRVRSMSDSKVLIDFNHLQTNTPTAGNRQRRASFPRQDNQPSDHAKLPRQHFQPTLISQLMAKPTYSMAPTDPTKYNPEYQHDCQIGRRASAPLLQSIPEHHTQPEDSKPSQLTGPKRKAACKFSYDPL